jgi:hypothetical protein
VIAVKGNLPAPHKTTRLSSSKVDRCGVWAVERWAQRPSLSYSQMVVEIRKRFDVGKTTAEQAIKRANEIFREQAAQLFTQDRIIAHLARLAENAERKGDDRTAARIVEAIARVSGVQAPEKFEDVTSGGLRAEDLTPEQLEALAALEG